MSPQAPAPVRPKTQYQSVELPERWPLVTMPGNRNADVTKDPRLVNCIAEFDPVLKQYWISKRPGYTSGLNLAGGGGSGAFFWNTNPYSIFGANLYKLSALLSGAMSSTGQMYHFDIVDAVPPLLVMGNRTAAYFTDGAAVTQIVAAGFPATFVPGPVYLGGYVFVMRPDGGIQNSDSLNPVNWNVLNVIKANSYSDAGIALARQLSYLIAFKEWSTQVFYNAGNPTGSPLAPLDGGLYNYGCADGESVVDVDGILFWASTNRSLGVQVMKMDQLKLEVVSTPPVERILDARISSFFSTPTIRSFGLKLGGHRFYIMGIQGGTGVQCTLVYDLDQKLWYQWSNTAGNRAWPFVAATNDGAGNRLVQGNAFEAGKLYIVGPDYTYPTDNGTVYNADIYTPQWDAGVNRRKTLNAFSIQSIQTPGSILQVRCSDDDYQSWSNYRNLDLSRVNPTLTQCGTFYRRALNLRHACATSLRITGGDMQYDVGTL